MPDGLKSIGNNAFRNCESLSEITIPWRVLTIGIGAFVGCRSLRSIYMHASLGYDVEEAFDEDVWKDITLVDNKRFWDTFQTMAATKHL